MLLDVLPMLAGLASVRCVLEYFGGSPRLDALALSRELRNVTLTWRDSGPDLCPLTRLPLLRDLTLWFAGHPADTSPLARIPGLRVIPAQRRPPPAAQRLIPWTAAKVGARGLRHWAVCSAGVMG